MRLWSGMRVGHHAWVGGRLDYSALGYIWAVVAVLLMAGLLRESGLLAMLADFTRAL